LVWHAVLFDILLVVACLYALVRGGAPERLVALMLVAAFYASIRVTAPYPYGFHHVEVGLFLVDLALFAALYLLSLFSTRFWPIWMTAMQGLSLLAHVMALTPQPSAFGYQALEEFWAIPQLILLIVATYRHRRRLARNGTDTSWTISFVRSAQPNRG
jgi:hypothetical protein